MSTIEAQGIVELYCQSYGLVPEDIKVISKRDGRTCFRRRRVYNGIHVDYMRMCLSHLFVCAGLGSSKIAGLVGYTNHTAVIQWKAKTKAYIENKDVFVFPYWERLQSVIGKV